ncbi:protein of unknown function [Streptococcus thermophilus]|nr:protein of unknown function [Streptococcus thermophilus]
MTQFFSESDTLSKYLKNLVLLVCWGSDVVILTNVTPLLEIGGLKHNHGPKELRATVCA